MTRTLILFTQTFPYGRGESFVAYELPSLLVHFDQIRLVPLLPDEGPAREVPKGVSVEPPLWQTPPSWRAPLAGLAAGGGPGDWTHELAQVLRSGRARNLARFVSVTLRTRALLSQTRVQSLLYQPASQAVAYFYWARGAADLVAYRKPALPTVVRFHGADLYEARNGGYLPLRRGLLSNMDYGAPVSDDGKQHLITTQGQSGGKLHVHRLGTTDHGLGPAPSGEVAQLLTCCSIREVKRLPLLVQALHRVTTPLVWTHLGDGPGLAHVRELATSLPPHVTARLPGFLPHDSVIDHYRSHPIDLFVNVSASEGVPVAIMEAMSFGVPVIATEVGGTAELLGSQGGLLLKANPTAQDIARAIDAHLGASDAQAAKRVDARSTWMERATAEKNHAIFASAIARLATEPRP